MDIEHAYNQALDYLYSFVDYSRERAAIMARAQFKLERMFTLMQSFSNPQDAYPTLHVGGTKGKGSTCALLASALTAAGLRTGLYTSPHLQDFAERIQVDGQPIPHLELATLVEEMKPVIASIPDLTVFEITTALAFLYFARREVAAAVIEVGLGGRLDATNIITPRLSVITSLSYDHMVVLGDTLTLIAGEKAGIIKPGVPVVSAPQVKEALLVLQRVAGEQSSPFTLVGRDLRYQPGDFSLDGQDLTILPPGSGEPFSLRIPLLGRHQLENAATAFAALQGCGLPVPQPALRKGFASVSWPCRFEVARRNPPVIFDSAHNQDSFLRLSTTLEDYFPGLRVILIMGASEDKNLPGMLEEIKPRLSRLIAVRADHPRAMTPQELVARAAGYAIPAEPAVSVPAALRRALDLSAASGEIILAAGSMFATAEVKTAWQELFPSTASLDRRMK